MHNMGISCVVIFNAPSFTSTGKSDFVHVQREEHEILSGDENEAD